MKKRLLLIMFVMGISISLIPMVISKTPDGETPSVESICDDAGLTGEAWDLCNAYCEAQDCDINTEGKKSCEVLKKNFEKVTGSNILPCDIIEQACCLSDGSCEDVTVLDCEGIGGFSQGEGTDCTIADCPLPPEEGCCLPDGSCEDVTVLDCEGIGGFSQGEGTDCTIADCPLPPEEGCCLPDGSCEDVTVLECEGIGGFSQGEGTDCTIADCIIITQTI